MPRFDPHPARRPTLIAGASSGIGAATATELAARGFPNKTTCSEIFLIYL
jgi:hypothetical protein